MNIYQLSIGSLFAVVEGSGGLFDFNATLPLMALQFILLTVVLTFLFYKPVANLLETRESFINTNLSTASDKLLQADELCKQYETQLKEAKVGAQVVIAEAEAEAKTLVNQELDQARKDAAKLVDQVNKQLEAQKELALKQLEAQIDELSQLIKEKLLGKVSL